MLPMSRPSKRFKATIATNTIFQQENMANNDSIAATAVGGNDEVQSSSKYFDGDGNGCNSSTFFTETSLEEAKLPTDGVRLRHSFSNGEAFSGSVHAESPIILPWLGYGTYKLGGHTCNTYEVIMQAIECGYRCIDTAFVYGGETTEKVVGDVLYKLLSRNLYHRSQFFVITKHWRKFHGYDPTINCLKTSLRRLNLDYVDLYLMHWPGPPYMFENRRKGMEKEDPWHYTTISAQDMAQTRAETWRAMEDGLRMGLTRAIGVSNMTIKNLEELKKTATIWPPAVNQIEVHPLHQQKELMEYCKREGIVVQAYASLGGQDMGKKDWNLLLKDQYRKSKAKSDLMNSDPVLRLSEELKVTPSQVLLRWGLEKGCTVIPKTRYKDRMMENMQIFHFSLKPKQVRELEVRLVGIMKENYPKAEDKELNAISSLTWRRDPLRYLKYE